MIKKRYKEELLNLAQEKLDEIRVFIKELKRNAYDEEELKEILDNWGSHDI